MLDENKFSREKKNAAYSTTFTRSVYSIYKIYHIFIPKKFIQGEKSPVLKAVRSL